MPFKNPSTGETLPEVPATDPAQLTAITRAARSAQEAWAKRPLKERGQLIKRIKAVLRERSEEAAQLVSAVNGKTIIDALATEVLPIIMSCDYYASEGLNALRPERLKGGHWLFANKRSTLHFEPVGLVGIISPWNYPLAIPFGEVLMAIAAGNAVLLKVASNVAPIGPFVQSVVEAAGAPRGLVTNVNIPGREAGKLLLDLPVDKLFFTGSVGVGKQLAALAAASLTPLVLELGGNDPVIVLANADLERASNCIVWAGYQNAGQSCGGVERVFVDRSVYAPLVELLVAKTRALRHGPPGSGADIGAITTADQLKTIESQLEEAQKGGARIIAQSQPVGKQEGGRFLAATLLVDVRPNMRVMADETFGPVVPVAPFDSIDEAVALANDCKLALTASVFGSGKAAREVAARLHAGVVTMNDHLYTHGLAETPWGGWKDSGVGRTHGKLGLREMCNAKCINEELLPACLVPRNIWWYPFSDATAAGLRGAIALCAPRGPFEFLAAAARVVPWAAGVMLTPWRPAGAPKAPASACWRALCGAAVAGAVAAVGVVAMRLRK